MFEASTDKPVVVFHSNVVAFEIRTSSFFININQEKRNS